ncbi:preQ1-regulated inosine-uridine nucleoside hydrolase [Streptococcus sp. DD11]|uniref:nucleoside hydrolase n=1 Tax=Streptococcus sp. DD11 TaxID=1777879 RepID=UPI0007958847|nr:nucleoside hydrolase [Streptococcus sp. DD11]KXT83079.1 preQ1-regulated inosine-uridine nucleoside hydrolase [Streptococcus sp. DD11]
MKKRKIIIDCDPGIDDSLALLYAIQHPGLEVAALTVTAGNVPVELGADNAFKILERLNRLDIPVYAGADRPLVRDFVSAQDTHGMDGLGDSSIKRRSTATLQPETASDFLAAYFREQQDTSLIALGPLTNIALALRKNPLLGQHMERFVCMGGSYKSHGNCSPVAEYNYWCDPHAAQEVYQKLGRKIEMIGLDVTRQIVLTPNLLEYMHFIQPEVAAFVRTITRFYWDFHWKYEHIIGCVINDPLAVAHFLHEDLCQGFDAFVDLATEGPALGQTVVDAYDFYHRPANAFIAQEVSSQLFFQDFLAVILEAPQEMIAQDLRTLQLG